jgi:hypothetical protein
MSILLEMGKRTARSIDGDMREVGTTKPFYLGVEVRKVAPLQQRVVAEIDPGRHILGAERHLLGLGEVSTTRSEQPADHADRENFLR